MRWTFGNDDYIIYWGRITCNRCMLRWYLFRIIVVLEDNPKLCSCIDNDICISYFTRTLSQLYHHIQHNFHNHDHLEWTTRTSDKGINYRPVREYQCLPNNPSPSSNKCNNWFWPVNMFWKIKIQPVPINFMPQHTKLKLLHALSS